MSSKQIWTPSLLLSQAVSPMHKATIVGWLRQILPGRDGPDTQLMMEGLQRGLTSQVQDGLGSYDQL